MPKIGEKRYVKQLAVVAEEHFGTTVWTNRSMDNARKAHCLCLNCAKMNPGEPDHCRIAQEGYELCRRNNVTFCMTRCPEWEPAAK